MSRKNDIIDALLSIAEKYENRDIDLFSGVYDPLCDLAREITPPEELEEGPGFADNICKYCIYRNESLFQGCNGETYLEANSIIYNCQEDHTDLPEVCPEFDAHAKYLHALVEHLKRQQVEIFEDDSIKKLSLISEAPYVYIK